jgi:formylglycine-generating enzyme required for sulfatase activity
MKLVRIPAGKFLMGSPPGEKGASPRERPQHEVEITRPFYLGAHPVTQGQYVKVVGSNPSHFRPGGGGAGAVGGLKTDSFPVENVNWDDAVAFCKQLSELPAEKKAGRLYRLPTEAEWEYACRAGTSTATPFGNSISSNQANFHGQSPYGDAPKGPELKRPSAVGSYKPNAWGLFDMPGNVCEWCADWFGQDYYRTSPKKDPPGPATGSSRVLRNCSWNGIGVACRSAYRGQQPPTSRQSMIGFRVACTVPGGR